MKQAPVKIPMYNGSAMNKSWREWFSDIFISSKSLRFPARSSDPIPEVGESVIWLSDGNGAGDDGDVMISISNTSGVIKTTTLVDFSSL